MLQQPSLLLRRLRGAHILFIKSKHFSLFFFFLSFFLFLRLDVCAHVHLCLVFPFCFPPFSPSFTFGKATKTGLLPPWGQGDRAGRPLPSFATQMRLSQVQLAMPCATPDKQFFFFFAPCSLSPMCLFWCTPLYHATPTVCAGCENGTCLARYDYNCSYNRGQEQ